MGGVRQISPATILSFVGGIDSRRHDPHNGDRRGHVRRRYGVRSRRRTVHPPVAAGRESPSRHRISPFSSLDGTGGRRIYRPVRLRLYAEVLGDGRRGQGDPHGAQLQHPRYGNDPAHSFSEDRLPDAAEQGRRRRRRRRGDNHGPFSRRRHGHDTGILHAVRREGGYSLRGRMGEDWPGGHRRHRRRQRRGHRDARDASDNDDDDDRDCNCNCHHPPLRKVRGGQLDSPVLECRVRSRSLLPLR
mmetsp:Transcript_23028/g.67952  ORF Transcript_23028/g.67952 Transcript_23028/m.67952 type:complete len:245 (+) Transcript_23028:1389-2123(+)